MAALFYWPGIDRLLRHKTVCFFYVYLILYFLVMIKKTEKTKKEVNYNSKDGVCALYRALSKMSVCSRTAAKELIIGGEVKVNGKIINNLTYPVNVKRDKIIVKGSLVKEKKLQYMAFNKPAGYETSARSSAKNSKTIYDIIPFAKEKNLNPVGRLDKDSHGLIILTNDNEFLNDVSGSESKISKYYKVKTDLELSEDQLVEFSEGIVIDDGRGDTVKTKPCKIRHVAECMYSIILAEGLNRQIRKMFAYFDIKVVDLFRYKIGSLEIGGIKDGEYFYIKPADVIK